MRNRKLLIGGGVALLLVGVMTLRVIQASADVEAEPTVAEIRGERGVPVRVARVETGALAVWRDFNGTVSGIRESVIRARTGDQVADVPVSVGAAVRAGQIVIRQRGDATAARVRQAEAALRQAQRTAERLRPLWEAGAISDHDWDAAETQLELASADLAAARDAVVLRSPIDGVVTEVVARPGLIPDAGDPLVRVADLSSLLVTLRVSPSEALEIHAGQPARAQGVAEGEVRRVALQADPFSRLVEVEVGFPGGAPLIPGTLVTVEILVGSRDDALYVPPAAVGPDGTTWVVGAGDVAERRAVTTGLRTRSAVEVVDGLEAGQHVVVGGGSLLSEGAAVRIVNAAVLED